MLAILFSSSEKFSFLKGKKKKRVGGYQINDNFLIPFFLNYINYSVVFKVLYLVVHAVCLEAYGYFHQKTKNTREFATCFPNWLCWQFSFIFCLLCSFLIQKPLQPPLVGPMDPPRNLFPPPPMPVQVTFLTC